MSMKNESKIKKRIEILQKQSELVRGEIELEALLAKRRVKNIGMIALGIGGGLVFSAILLKSIFRKKDDKPSVRRSRRVYHNFKDKLVAELSNQALLLFLTVAKNKIRAHLLQSTSNVEKNDSEIAH